MAVSYSNTASPRWSLLKSLPIEQDNFAATSSPYLARGRPGQYIDEKVQIKTDPLDSVTAAVQLLDELGLKPRQIRQLRQLEYRNALHCLADTDEDELDEACAVLRSRTSQRSSRHDSLRLSYQSSSRYPSGVPSLVSGQSSLRDSMATSLSIPIDDGNACDPEHVGGVSGVSAFWNSRLDDMHLTSTCLQHNINMPIIEEDRHFYNENPQDIDSFGFHLRYQDNGTISSARIEQSGASHCSRTAEQAHQEQSPTGGDPFIPQQDRLLNQNKKPRFPCSESGCPKHFSSENEFSKHLTGDHDRDASFACRHEACPLYPFVKSRLEMWKKHHSTHHRGCPGYETCKEETRTRERLYWACGICSDLFTDVKSYAKHYKNHFSEGKFEHADNDFSTIIRSLLRQDATRDKWSERGVDVRDLDGTFRLSWEPDTCADLREALEYGTFRGSTITEPAVVGLLLENLITRARPHRKRHASSPPVREEPQSAPSRSFQGRLLSSNNWRQVRADTASALAHFDPFDAAI